MARLNTQLEAEAAEFFVLAHLLLNKVFAHKNYTRHKDYDIVAVNPANNKMVSIQVKSRFRIGATGFPISNFNSDFVVFCRLNRSLDENKGHGDPDFYIFPTKLVEKHINATSSWQKFYVNQLPKNEQYYENWSLIYRALQ
jgi:hypothetical protein